MPKPGALKAIDGGGRARQFDADARAQERENTPVTIGGVDFTRRRKDWTVSRLMRKITHAQEKAIALSARVRSRITEHEVRQAEAARDGDDKLELELEATIEALIARVDEATEQAELVSYQLLALLLAPKGRDDLAGWGPEAYKDPADADPSHAAAAIAFLQPELDVEDAAALVGELTGSNEPDPQGTPSSGDGSS